MLSLLFLLLLLLGWVAGAVRLNLAFLTETIEAVTKGKKKRKGDGGGGMGRGGGE